jgi:serine/threonine protein kinase
MYSLSETSHSSTLGDGVASLSVCISSTPASSAIIACHYHIVRPLSKTTFGRTLLCEDMRDATLCKRKRPAYAVVKESSSAQMAQIQKTADAVIGEDVRKEARVLRFLGREAPTENHARTFLFTQSHIDRNTCGLSDAFWASHADPITGKLSIDSMMELKKGAGYIPLLFGEHEKFVCAHSAPNDARLTSDTPSNVHFLVSEYASQGDLYGLITNAPNKRLDEFRARQIFRQLLLAVRYAHARSVVHLDISCENVCIMENGDARLIDWGLATIHPHCTSVSAGGESTQSVDTSRRLVTMNNPVSNGSGTSPCGKVLCQCNCKACTSSVSDLEARAAHQVSQSLRRFPAQAAAVTSKNDNVSWFVHAATTTSHTSFFSVNTHQITNQDKLNSIQMSSVSLYRRCKMLMRPVCVQYMVPGKQYTTAPELMNSCVDAAPWDAYGADTFALGVLLYVMLTGMTPFTIANTRECKWYEWISSGKWRTLHGGAATEVYKHLSEEARDLIDVCIKSQYLRPTPDQLLTHAWLNAPTLKHE